MSAVKLLISLFVTLIILPQAYSQKLKPGKGPEDYQKYKPNFSGIMADKAMYQEYRSLAEQAKKEGFRRALFERRIELMEGYLAKNPKDVDAH